MITRYLETSHKRQRFNNNN